MSTVVTGRQKATNYPDSIRAAYCRKIGGMIGISLDSRVSSDFPDTLIWFVTAYGLANYDEWPRTVEALDKLEREVASGEWTPFTKEQPQIASWHEAYRQFGTNPNRMRPSVDALSRRLTRDGRLPRINSAVDAYNLVSVKYGTPAGAFDLDALDGDLEIRYAQPGDEFTPMGEPDVVESPSDGEVVYAVGNRVLTRHWNYRDSEHTKVTPDSRNVMFIVERISAEAVPNEVISKAQVDLSMQLMPHAQRLRTASVERIRPTTKVPGKGDDAGRAAVISMARPQRSVRISSA